MTTDWSAYMLRCWELAKNSDCTKMNFGAVIVLEGKVIAEGWNHKAYNFDCCNLWKDIPSGTRLELCAAVHAEQAAIFAAYKNGHSDLSSGTLYVAGLFGNGQRLIKSAPGLYCSFCARLIAEAGIKTVVVPTKDGEATLSLEDVLRTAFEFAQGLQAIKIEKDSGS